MGMSSTVTQPTTWFLPQVTLTRIALAALAVGLAVVLTMLAGESLAYTRFALFFAAVAFAGAIGGVPLGLMAMVSSLVVAEIFIFDVPGARSFNTSVVIRDGAFALVSLSIVLLFDRLRLVRTWAERRESELQRFATELTSRASDLEHQVAESTALAEALEDVNRRLAAQTDAAQRAAERSDRLHQFTALLLEQAGEAAVAAAIVEDGRRALDATAAAVIRLNDDDLVEVLAARGGDENVFGDVARFCTPGSPVFDAVQAGTPVWLPDAAQLRRDYPSIAQLAVGPHRAWAALPLQMEQRKLGCLALGFDRASGFTNDDRSFMLLLAQQCAQALDRARIYDLERRARVRAEFAERRLAFLADASERLASSLDFLATLANLAQYSVPEFADWCLVHLASDDGTPLLIAAAHQDPMRLARRRELEQKYPPSLRAELGIGRVLRTGELEHVAAVSDDTLQAVARDAEQLKLLRALEIREQLAVPIFVDERAVGVLTFAISESSRTFDEADITLAEELGLRAGQAVQNARLYQAAHHASEAKSNFLAVMSHELRTPLNAIIGYSDLLVLGVPNSVPEKAMHQVQRIRVAAAALLTLVEEVLSFSRIEAGKEEIRISPVELGGLVRDCLTLVDPLAAQKKLQLEVSLPDEPIKIVSDERKIRQILTNLLSNAVKFTEHGFVGVQLKRTDTEIHIVVEDTGIGIPQEHLERIFDPFWQVEPASTRRFGGTGLGLGVARKLARLLNGRLDVKSEEGKGSTFTLVLPLHSQVPGRST